MTNKKFWHGHLFSPHSCPPWPKYIEKGKELKKKKFDFIFLKTQPPQPPDEYPTNLGPKVNYDNPDLVYNIGLTIKVFLFKIGLVSNGVDK